MLEELIGSASRKGLEGPGNFLACIYLHMCVCRLFKKHSNFIYLVQNSKVIKGYSWKRVFFLSPFHIPQSPDLRPSLLLVCLLL